jgi:hypothetical protein
MGGKFQTRSIGWDENLTFLEGDVLEIAVRKWPLGGEPRSGRSATGTALAQHYFPTEEWRCNGVCDIVTWDGNAVALRRNWSFGRKSAGAVEAGNRVADEPDRFNNGLDGQICRRASLRNRPTACACWSRSVVTAPS